MGSGSTDGKPKDLPISFQLTACGTAAAHGKYDVQQKIGHNWKPVYFCVKGSDRYVIYFNNKPGPGVWELMDLSGDILYRSTITDLDSEWIVVNGEKPAPILYDFNKGRRKLADYGHDHG